MSDTDTAATPWNLRRKLLAVMAEVSNVPKLGQNTQGRGYKYQMAKDIFPKVQAACLKYGINFLADHLSTEYHAPHASAANNPVYVCSVVEQFSFLDVDSDDIISGSSRGHAFDSSDKAENKAKTAALKYFLKQTFLIGEEDDDSEKETIETRMDGRGSPERKEEKGGTERNPPNDGSKTLTTQQAEAMVVLLTHAAAAKHPIDKWIKAWGLGAVEGLDELGQNDQVSLAVYSEMLKLGQVSGKAIFEKAKSRQELTASMEWPE